jgi:quinol monooxygenase YgiN
MIVDRREAIAGASAAALVGGSRAGAAGPPLYGLIGRMTARPGQGAALADALKGATQAMPGCLSYIVGISADAPDVLWITEVWTSPESHAASLAIPAVREAIGIARPLIQGMERIAETRPVSGVPGAA